MSNFTEKKILREVSVYKILVEQGYEWISLSTSRNIRELQMGSYKSGRHAQGVSEEYE